MTCKVMAVQKTPSHDEPTRAHVGVCVPFDLSVSLSREVGNPCLAWQQLEFLDWIRVCDTANRIVFWLLASIAVGLGITLTFLQMIRLRESGRKRLEEISISHGIDQP